MPLYLNGKKVSPVKAQKSDSMDDYTIYTGPYVVNPLTATDTVLATKLTLLEQNVIVRKYALKK